MNITFKVLACSSTWSGLLLPTLCPCGCIGTIGYMVKSTKKPSSSMQQVTLKKPAACHSKCPCGKWLSSRTRNHRMYCINHALKREERVDKNIFDRSYLQMSLTDIPLKLRRQWPKLFAHWNTTESGCKIWCLALRPDIASVRVVSRKIMHAFRRFPDIEDPHKHVAWWTLVAHRMYDPASNVSLVIPFVVNDGGRPQLCNQSNLERLSLKYREYNEQAAHVYFNDRSKFHEFEAKQSNPTGLASAHSGHTWLQNVLNDDDAFERLEDFSEDLADLVFQTRSGKRRPTVNDMAKLHVESEGGTKLDNTGVYYEMSIYRIAKHALASRSGSHGGRLLYPACDLTPELWQQRLLDKGALSGAKTYGLQDFETAKRFTIGMQTAVPGYCFCDLACFLCLAK
jgi:hypothetical protein